MRRRVNIPIVAVTLLCGVAGALPSASRAQVFDPTEFLDESTLDVVVVEDWHVDTARGNTRQKLIEIKVAEWWPGFDYRVLVRLIVPLAGTATGFRLTGGHSVSQISTDAAVSGFDAYLIAGGVGLVHTVVQAQLTGGSVTSAAMLAQFLATKSIRYSNPWIWTMIEMRAVTAAYAETAYFEAGNVAATGGSKNCAAPSAASIHDARITAVHASACSPYLTSLDLFDPDTVAAVEAANDWFFVALAAGEIDPGEHSVGWYGGNVFGNPQDLHVLALAAGWTWDDLRALAASSVPEFFLSAHWDDLMAAGKEYLLHPPTHDWVARDILHGARAHPQIPVYHAPNGGHGQTLHPAAQSNQNASAFLTRHFFGTVGPLLAPATSSHELDGDRLHVTVRFDGGLQPASGRIWWIHDRDPGGSGGYLWKRIPDQSWMDMTFDSASGAWLATIPVDTSASHVDYFSNHGHVTGGFQTRLSSPYTRVALAAGVTSNKLKLTDDDAPPITVKKRKIVVRAGKLKGAPGSVVAPDFGSPGDPTVSGGQVTIYRAGARDDELVSLSLPAGGWTAAGNATSPGYVYRDRQGVYGPIGKVHVRKGKLTITGKGDGLFELTGAPHEAMVVRLSLGTGASWCASAPARTPAEKRDTTRKFLAERNHPAPASCPLVRPSGSPSGAFSN